MDKRAVFFGAIGAVAETSDIQRRAYNQALDQCGVGWRWDEDTYRDLLAIVGGRDRLSLLGRATGQPLTEDTIAKVHTLKTEIACKEVRDTRPPLRPGVAALLSAARGAGLKTAFVTSTARDNIDAILDATDLGPAAFDHIVDRDSVAAGKPDPAPYFAALEALGLSPHEALAVEDTAASVASAKRAGITVIATPGAYTNDQDFFEADLVLPGLAADGTLDPRVADLLGRAAA
ncbi:MAG: HAD-IA family hydrolase [Pseudomonadota bacterium]